MAVAQATSRRRAWAKQLGCWAAVAAMPAAAWLLHRAVQTLLLNRLQRFRSPAVKTTPYGNALPAAVHVSLRRKQLKEGRLVVIGDVHGCNRELQQLLVEVKFDAQKDNLVLVGDLVNKGPDSVGVLRTVRQCQGLAVRGNHDDHTLHKWHLWKKIGCIPAKDHWVTQLQAEDIEMLKKLPFSISLPDYGIIIVHAGLVPQLAPCSDDDTSQEPRSDMQPTQNTHPCAIVTQQRLKNMITMRELSPSKDGARGWTALEAPPQGYKGNKVSLQPWAQVWPGPAHVLFGHDARRRLQLAPYATGLDTGCVYGGQLTAAVLPPLSELLTGSPAVAAHAAAAGGGGMNGYDGSSLPALTREDLQLQLVTVSAAQVHSQPKGTD